MPVLVLSVPVTPVLSFFLLWGALVLVRIPQGPGWYALGCGAEPP